MMDQEAKSVEIQRYAMKSIEVYAEEVEAPDGYWVSYADHIAALAAKDAAISALKGAVHADVAEFRRDSATLEAQSEQIRVLREALENPSAHTHCCFCGTYNVDDPKGYAGERACHACGHGGQGEADLPQMAANAWGNRRPAALASTAPVAEKKEGE